MSALERGALELRDLLEHFISLSEAGVRDCLDGNSDSLAATLHARDLVANRVEQVTREMDALRSGASAESLASADRHLDAIQRAASQAASANTLLLERAQDLRVDLGRQIDQLRQEMGASAAYAEPRRPLSGAYRALR